METQTQAQLTRRRTTIRDLTVALVMVTVGVFLLFGLASFGLITQRTVAAQAAQSGVLADNLAIALRFPLLGGSETAVAEIIRGYERTESVAYIRLTGPDGDLIYETAATIPDANDYTLNRAITGDNEVIGQIAVTFTGQTVNQLRQNIFFILLGLLLATLLAIMLAVQVLMRRYVSHPLSILSAGIDTIASGDYRYRLPPVPQADVNFIAERANGMAEQIEQRDQELRGLIDVLEVRVKERTQDLALAAEIGRRVSQIYDLPELLAEATELIRERFALYHVQIYLVDETGDWLALKASCGAAGAQLLAQRHRLGINQESINGQAAVEKRTVMVRDVTNSPYYLPHPLLPETVAETAVPLLTGQRLLGVLDLQSADLDFFTPERIPALEVMAGFLTIAIESATLFKEEERLRAELSENSQFLDSVIDNIPLMLFVKEAETLRFVRWNQAGANLIGVPVEELVGKSDHDFFPPAEAAFFIQKDREVLNKGILVDIPEEPLETVDKGVRLLHTVKVPIMGSDGQPKYLLGISEDITDRKEREAQLRERVKELNLLNEIGRQSAQQPDLPDFVRFVAERIPAAMQYPDLCQANITLQGEVYGQATASSLPCQIVEGIEVDGERLGQITIAYSETRTFLDEESALIGEIGRRLSSYITSRRLLAQVQANVNDLQTVAEISARVTSAKNKQQLLQDVVDLTRTRFDLYHAHIYLYDAQADELALTAGSGEKGRRMVAENHRLPSQARQSLVARAARSGHAFFVNDTANDPTFLPHPLLPATQSELAAPLLIGGELLGVLDLQAQQKGFFAPGDVDIFTALAAQIAVAMQNADQIEQTQTALLELNALQRLMAHEGWQEYLQTESHMARGFLADQEAIKPLAGPVADDGELPAFPMQVRGVTIGRLGVRTPHGRSLSPQDSQFLEAISLQVAEALEKARLFAETERARSQTEALFSGSEWMVRATNMADILHALVAVTELQQFDSASLVFFNEPWQATMPNSLTVAALWRQDGQPPEIDLNRPFPTAQYPILKYLSRERPFISRHISQDPRLDDETRRVFGELRRMKSAIAIPLITGDSWIGFVMGLSGQIIDLSETAVRQLVSLAGQAATVAQTQQLFAEAQTQAQQEQVLRLVSDRVYAAADTESMLRTAVEEIGRALGMETFLVLEPNGALPETAVAPTLPGNSNE